MPVQITGKVPIFPVGAHAIGVVNCFRTASGTGVVPVNTQGAYVTGVVKVFLEVAAGTGIVKIDNG